MTTIDLTRVQTRAPVRSLIQTPLAGRPRTGGLRRFLRSPAALGLVAIWCYQVAATRLSDSVAFPFDDEGLYIYMGHRMLDHLTQGAFLHEFPGSYFSGAPALYPVLAALVDDLGGVQAVRDLSLVFSMISVAALVSLGHKLFGTVAGVAGAAVFAVAGPTILQSQWATYDAMMLTLLLLGSALGVASAQATSMVWAPVVSALLCLAFLTKYAALGYLPVVLALFVVCGWARWGTRILGAATFTGVGTVVLVYFVLMLWGRDIIPGIEQTTTERQLISPAPRSVLLQYTWQVLGAWLTIAAVAVLAAALVDRRNLMVVGLLFAGAIVAPAQQIRIGEFTSLGKHLGFSAAFAGLLAGYLVWLIAARLHRVLAALAVGGVLVALIPIGLHQASLLRTGYAGGAELERVLRIALSHNPGQPVLGEQPSGQRYALRDVVAANRWGDTYSFSYDGKQGRAAYQAAIEDHYFGVIYLSFTTGQASDVVANLGAAQGSDHYYHLTGRVPRMMRGERIGWWLIWTPQTELLTDMGTALDPKP